MILSVARQNQLTKVEIAINKKSFHKSIERILDELMDEGRVIRFKQGKTNCFYKTKKPIPVLNRWNQKLLAFLLLEKYSKDLPE